MPVRAVPDKGLDSEYWSANASDDAYSVSDSEDCQLPDEQLVPALKMTRQHIQDLI